MSIFHKYGQRESNYVWVGDQGFIGLDARTAPDKLPEGVVSEAENVRMRTKEIETRPGYPFVGWFYPDWYPFDQEYGQDGEFKGTWTNNGADSDVTITAGTSQGTPYTDGYQYLRFSSGTASASGLILEATAEYAGSGNTVEVEPVAVAAGQNVTNEPFVWAKMDTSSSGYHLTRSVISNAGQTPKNTGTFKDPDGAEYAVVVTESSTWFGRKDNRPFEVTIPGGVNDDAYLMQAFDDLILFRGYNQIPLIYTTVTNAWNEIDSTDQGDYTLPIPNAKRGLYFQNRTWVHQKDTLYIGDIGNATRYYWLENEFRINTGESDEIVTLFPFGKYAILVFKENSIYLLDNLYGDIIQNMRVRQISSRIGCGAAETVANVADDVWFCDKNGDVWSIKQVDEERAQLSGEPVSWPIKPMWDKRNLSNVSTWAAAYYDGYYYLFQSEPREDVIEDILYSDYDKLNVVSVYDTINQSWVSMDWSYEWDMIGRPMILNALEDQRLMMVDETSGNLRIIGYGLVDGSVGGNDEQDNVSPISRVMSRGFFAEKGSAQQFSRVRASIAKLDGDYRVDVFTDGEEEYTANSGGVAQEILSRITDDNNRHTYINASEVTGYDEWDPTNVNNDFDDPYRYDYSVYPSSSTLGIKLSSSGIPTTRHQIIKNEVRIKKTGNYAQVRVRGDNGNIRIKDMSVAVRKNMNLQGERV